MTHKASANRATLHVHSNPADRLLSCLEGVERHGGGWRAKCPAHDGKSRGSLSIAVADDGRLLVHDFGGCTAIEVLRAVGLELADLYPERITHASTPAQRREVRQSAKQAQWAAALDRLEFEARVVLVAADQISQGEPLNDTDSARLLQAVQCIEEARTVFRGR